MKIFWKVYFWVFAFIVVSGYSTLFSKNTIVYYYFDIFFSIIGLLGLWCYAHEKALAHPILWQVFFCFFFFWNVINIIYGPFFSVKPLGGQEEQLYAKLISVAISLPAYFALFLYGFRSKEMWHKA